MKGRNLLKKFTGAVQKTTDRAYDAVATGAVGRVFSAYPETNRALSETAVARKWRARRIKNRGTTLRRGMAQAMDHSPVRGAFRRALDGACRYSLRTVGLFFLTMGAYYGIVEWLISGVWRGGEANAAALFASLSMLIIGVMLSCSTTAIGYALARGMLTGWFLRSVLGLSEDALTDIPKEGRQSLVLSIPTGMVAGALCALVGPLALGIALLLAFLALLLFSLPEAGVMLLILYVPFGGFLPHNTFFLTAAALLIGAGYICRLMRGTRTFRLEIQDLAVLALLLSTLLLAVSAGGDVRTGVLTSVLLIALYFPAVNMLSTPRWLSRCRWMLIGSATGASLVAILQFVLAFAASLQSVTVVSVWELSDAVRAGFADHTTFAYFTVLAFPFALYGFARERTRHRMLAGLACVSIAVAGALTLVQSAWVALAAELVVLCLVRAKRIVPYMLSLIVISPGVIALLPQSWRARLGYVMLEHSDLSFARVRTTGEFLSRVYFEKGEGFFGLGRGLTRLFFGLGRGGVEAVGVLYTSLTAEELTGNFSFWSVSLAEGGILGVLLPCALFFLFLQNCFSTVRRARDIDDHVLAVVGIILVAGVLVFSLFRYTWYDPAALLVFFLFIALITADSRYHRMREMPSEEIEQNDAHANLDYRLTAAPKKERKEKRVRRKRVKGGRR